MIWLLCLLPCIYADSPEIRDATASFTQLCNYYNFKAENHTVITSDGYKLLLFRIPGSLHESSYSKPVAFMMHGLIDLADTWITNEPDKAPGFMMARAGYDVWFGNSRGTRYSREHVKWSDKDRKFWEFTWMHMAEFDIPAMINYVLNYTQQEKLVYIGHSQGATQMFAHLAEKPEFEEKLSIFIGLAPAISVRFIKNDVLRLFHSVKLFELLHWLGVVEFMAPYDNTSGLFYSVCKVMGLICSSLLEFIADFKIEQDNIDRFPVILAHEPGGTSTLDMQHWQQMVNYPKYSFAKFDYGEEINIEKYGNKTPPVYDLSTIKGPLALFFGKEDRLATPEDANWLIETVPKEAIVHLDKDLNSGHLTFMWGKDMSYFNKVIELANLYTQLTKPERFPVK